jgi:glycosyltransferase involved in cell wall biosynthesis
MHIVALWQGIYPWDGRLDNFVRSFVSLGHSVSVVARGAEGDCATDEYLGAKIYRVPYTRLAATITQAPIPFGPLWMSTVARCVRDRTPDIVFVRDLPLMQVGYATAHRLRAALWFDMAEDYPATFRKMRLSIAQRLTVRNYYLARTYERWALSKADHVSVVVKESRDRVMAIAPRRDSRWCSIITNSPDRYFACQPRNLNVGVEPSSIPVLLYHGNLGPDRGLDTVIRAIALLADSDIKVKLLVLGKPETEIKRLGAMAAELGVADFVDCRLPIRYEHLPSAISQSFAGIIPHLYCEHTATTIPHKLFDCMSMGKPIIVSSVPPLRRIVTEEKCGISYQWDSPADLARSIEELVNDPQIAMDMGRNGLRAYEDKFSWSWCELAIQEILGMAEDVKRLSTSVVRRGR